MAAEDRTPRALAPRQGSTAQMGRPWEGNHPELRAQPARKLLCDFEQVS